LGLELKKEKVEHTENKGGQLKINFPNEVVSKLQSTAPKKENIHTPFSKAHKKSLKPFRKKYIPDNLPAKKMRDVKNFTKPNQVPQPEESRIVLMDIDPHRLHAYWEITQRDKKRVLKQLDASFKPPRQIIRVYDVTHINFDGKNAHSYFDIKTNRNRGNWYIDLWSSHKSLCAEIGMKSSLGDFYPISRSNFIDTPRDYQSSSDEEQWMRVSGNYEVISMLPAKPHKGKNKPEEASPPASQQSYKEDIPPERRQIKVQEKGPYETKELFTESKTTRANIKFRILENEEKDYYTKLQFISRHKIVKPKTPPEKKPHHGRVASSKEDTRKRLFPKIDIHYGSDKRWEKE